MVLKLLNPSEFIIIFLKLLIKELIAFLPFYAHILPYEEVK